MSRDPPQRREARFAKRRCALQPDSLTVGVRKAQATARQGGVTGTVAASLLLTFAIRP
ncbi:hypothetical protein SEEN978_10213 [Salmonella enterica subsp. enterica serovar Newport str. CVM 37978]|uniref:hypothetical protein n=1 Tax=Salmonella enterica TaxID=28901 RepID=UPI0002694EEA|nr:hypothetical protein SEEN978_10213 [Salmonella enterica subsp. enterica serovar Newport str. CVM 37978]